METTIATIAYVIWYVLQGSPEPLAGVARFDDLPACEAALKRTEKTLGTPIVGTTVILLHPGAAQRKGIVRSVRCGPEKAP